MRRGIWVLLRAARLGEAVRVAERVRVREIDEDEGQRLVRIIRRGSTDRVREAM